MTIVTPDLGPNYLQKFPSTSCQLHPYVKQYGSRSDTTIVKPDLGPNYLQKFTSISCNLHPNVKQHGSRSDQTIVKPEPGPNYLQKSFVIYIVTDKHLPRMSTRVHVHVRIKSL